LKEEELPRQVPQQLLQTPIGFRLMTTSRGVLLFGFGPGEHCERFVLHIALPRSGLKDQVDVQQVVQVV